MRATASIAALAVVLSAAPAWAQVATTERVSVSATEQGSGESYYAVVSADGGVVAFASGSPELVPGDSNGRDDLFVRDLATGAVERVDVSSTEEQATGERSYGPPAVSADGRYVAFVSSAPNLVPGDTNGRWDIFVRDRATGTTDRVSVTSGGNQVAADSFMPAISGDGRYVAFTSAATTLVAGDTNGVKDVFVHDRATGTVERVSVTSAGEQVRGASYYPSLSGDGRLVAFDSKAPDLVGKDTDWHRDVFVRDLVAGTTELASKSSRGRPVAGDASSMHPRLSGDGTAVAFTSSGANLVPGDTNDELDIFVRDLDTDRTRRVSLDSRERQGRHGSWASDISRTGRFVAFTSASALVAGLTRPAGWVFVRDRRHGVTRLGSVSADGEAARGGGDPGDHTLSADGRWLAFVSHDPDVVPGDTNGESDVFVRGPLR